MVGRQLRVYHPLVFFQIEKFSSVVPSEPQVSPGAIATSPEPEVAEEEHENMKNVLINKAEPHVIQRRRGSEKLSQAAKLIDLK